MEATRNMVLKENSTILLIYETKMAVEHASNRLQKVRKKGKICVANVRGMLRGITTLWDHKEYNMLSQKEIAKFLLNKLEDMTY